MSSSDHPESHDLTRGEEKPWTAVDDETYVTSAFDI